MTGEDVPVGLDLATTAPETLLAHLRGRGVSLPAHPEVRVLAGGVSGTVIAIVGDGRGLVVKQALARLAVPGEWWADQRRTVTEAHALERWHALTPEATADLVDLDEDNRLLTMTGAPAGWSSWKDQLLAATGTPSQRARATAIAGRLGEILARWHAGTADPEAWSGFDDHETFRLLRSDPFYRDLAAGHRDLRHRLTTLADALDRSRVCLVQGDFSPKNVLTPPDGPSQCWVVDHEVTVVGDPVFDLAFMLCHLTCKSVAGRRSWLVDVARTFWSGYRAGGGLPVDETALAAHTAALMLARVDGVSRVGYLDPSEQDRVRAATRAALQQPGTVPADLWRSLHEAETTVDQEDA